MNVMQADNKSINNKYTFIMYTMLLNDDEILISGTKINVS